MHALCCDMQLALQGKAAISHVTTIPPMFHSDILTATISTVGLLIFSSLHCC